jgi:hypothetical protein
MNIFDHLRKAANEIAQQAAARISNLDRQIAEIEEQKKKIETDRTKARGSLQRAANFPVKNGADYLCPSCWVDEGKMTPSIPSPAKQVTIFLYAPCARTKLLSNSSARMGLFIGFFAFPLRLRTLRSHALERLGWGIDRGKRRLDTIETFIFHR